MTYPIVACEIPTRQPFALVSDRYRLEGEAEIYRARNDADAFVVCVFDPILGHLRGSARLKLKPGCDSYRRLSEWAQLGACPHDVGLLDPPCAMTPAELDAHVGGEP